MLRPLVVANWKMHPTTARAARALFGAFRRKFRNVRGVNVAVAMPFPYLGLSRGTRTVALAAQDAFWERAGAYTGEVSPAMLKDLGVRYVIVGHSERRRIFGEDDAMINRKLAALLEAGRVPILAIGEESRESQEVVPRELAGELGRALAGIPRRDIPRVVIAYEPVWAISTAPGSKSDTPDHATSRAIYIRKLLTKLAGRRTAERVQIIYGGSVNAKNAASYLARDIRGMEGLLVGSASLDADEFATIVRSVAHTVRAKRMSNI